MASGTISPASGVLGCLDPVLVARPDGTMLVHSTQVAPAIGSTLTSYLAHWARAAPDRVFLAERDAAGAWRTLTYADAAATVRCLASAFLAHNLSAERPIAILSGNDIDHALVALAAMEIGVPYAPVSPPYSLISQDFAKLKYCMDLLTPGLIFVSDGKAFAPALNAVAGPDILRVAARNAEHAGAIELSTLLATPPDPRVDVAQAGVNAGTIAKFLLTSGSTGEPKAVINTQGMLMSNQAMLLQCFPFLEEAPPVLVDWLPWNHTFGSNHNFGMVLVHGGTLHIDAGKPVPAAIGATIANLREIAPSVYFNVPKGFEALLPALEAEEAFARHFFSRLKMLFYAGAGLSPLVWAGYQRLARAITGAPIPFVTGLGATETAPAALMNLMDSDGPGNMGHPMAGVTMKLVPNAGKLEIRVKAPTVTPGYWRSPELTAKAFDEEGFYCFGDAVRFATFDASGAGDPTGGFIFDGRVSEDFKLATGTWVSVGPLRSAFLAAFDPLAKDVVITGHDRDEIGALVFPDLERCRVLAGADLSASDILAHPAVHEAFADRLTALAKQSTGSSNRITRLILLEDLPSIDKGEITDKGSINQRAVLTHRKGEVEALYSEAPSSRIIRPAPAGAQVTPCKVKP